MMERRRIVELWGRQPDAVLVTLVRVEGSSYRRPGARMLVADASSAGTISGGCLEGDVVRRARWLARRGGAVEQYSTAFDDTAEIPFGLGCGGSVDLLFERSAAPEGAALLEAMQRSLGGVEARIVHLLPHGAEPLKRVIFDSEGKLTFRSAGLTEAQIDPARALVPGERYEGRFVERLEGPQRLVIFGAGQDASPLVDLAKGLGWIVMVADGRAQLALPSRFPQLAEEDVISTAAGWDERLAVSRNDAVVLMTHSYVQDRETLVRMLPVRPRYLGLLGSRHRSSLLIAEAAAITGAPIASCCDGVFAPVGLDLGGDGPEAIALAIVAEIMAVSAGRVTHSRRLNEEEVIRQIHDGGASAYLNSQCLLNA